MSRCPECGYNPNDRSGLREILESQGYDGRFLRMNFGPEKEGVQHLCPACGSVVNREDPETYLFVSVKNIDDVDLSEEHPSVAKAQFPPYLDPGDEVKECEVCGQLVMPSDDKIYDYYEDEEFVFCSRDCDDEWREEHYGSSGL